MVWQVNFWDYGWEDYGREDDGAIPLIRAVPTASIVLAEPEPAGIRARRASVAAHKATQAAAAADGAWSAVAANAGLSRPTGYAEHKARAATTTAYVAMMAARYWTRGGDSA